MKSQSYQELIKEICERFNLSHTSLKAITQAESSHVAVAIDDGYPLHTEQHVRLATYLKSQLSDVEDGTPHDVASRLLMMLQLKAREAHIKMAIERAQKTWIWPIKL